MTELSPITPPDELVKKIRSDALCSSDGRHDYELSMIHAAYTAGADQELEACCEWLENQPQWMEDLRAARRPKPPSDKELALNALSLIMSQQKGMFDGKPFNTIRRALEALPND
jgi:hypothetical protein